MYPPLSRSRLLLVATTLGLLALPLAADAKKKEPEQKPAAAAAPAAGAAAKDSPFQEWSKLTKGAEVSKGYFNLYKKRENLYLELKPEQMNQPVLGIFSFARGIGSNFLLGGLPLNDRLLEFQRSGDHVLVIEQNTRFAASGDPAFAKAKDLSIGNSVLASLKIESEQDSTKAVLVDLAPFLVSDVTDLAEGMRGALGGKSVRFDKDRSALGKIKVFPENAEIEALLTYSPNDRQGLDLPSVPDERYIPITVHYSFSKLPDVPMKPRLADDRVGYFLTAVKDFGRDDQENFWVRYVHRWRLERKEPGALASEGGASTLAEPVKPIVYYIDKTVPVAYRPYVKQGVERWQKAFEAAGFKNAIIAKDAPDDPNWDPEDVRYSTIRWITSSEPAFGAIGPSRVDPRSGEILDADILMEASFIQGFRNIYRRYAGPEAIADGVSLQTRSAWPAALNPELACDVMGAANDGGALLNIGMLVDGSLPPGSPVPDEFIGQALIWTTMHEVGHTLGLRHNFRSSTATPYDKLNDKAWTSQHGLAASVMDYMTPNISLDRSQQGEYYTSTVGDEDVWAIRYGYTPGSADLAADYKAVKAIADESNKPGHEYSTDEDTYPVDALDPRTNIFDLGNDPLRWAKDRTTYVSGLWKNGKLDERILGAQGEYPVLRRAMDTLLGQYATALGMAVKYVGGQYVSRNHRGQPDAKAPLTPVPAAKQREALDFLAQKAFAADAFTVAPALLNDLVQDRWTHWGTQDAFGPGNRLDYNLNDRVLAIQDRLLTLLLSQPLLARLREAESRSSDAFRVSEHLDRLTKMLWGDVGATPAELKALDSPGTRREIQRAYVDKLAALVVGPATGVPDDARALARLQLTRIDSRAAKALAATTPMGDYTRAHLTETRARIKRALDAQRLADAPAVAAPAGFGRGVAAEGSH